MSDREDVALIRERLAHGGGHTPTWKALAALERLEAELREKEKAEAGGEPSSPVVESGGMVHVLKCWPPFYEAAESGSKPFELRHNDRYFCVGDVLHLCEWAPGIGYTGRECHRLITYMVENVPGWGLREGYAILGLASTTDGLGPSPDSELDSLRSEVARLTAALTEIAENNALFGEFELVAVARAALGGGTEEM